MSRLRVVHNPKIPYDFLTAPQRVGAKPGRDEKNCDLEKVSVLLESGAQSKQTFVIFWLLPNESGPTMGGKKKSFSEKVSVSLESGAQSENSLMIFLTAPQRVGAEPGREEKLLFGKNECLA